jgi:uncharacterized protein
MIPEYLDVPIFPLPNVTFFPQTMMPLHVFEPRYRVMTANCLAGDRLMGVALLKEGWQRDYFGRPPISRIFGVGKIVDHEELGNGCYNIMLDGLYRVRLIEEFHTDPYRTGRVQVLVDPPIDEARVLVSALIKELHMLTRRLAAGLPPLQEPIQNAWSAHPHPLVVVNLRATALVIDAYDRQSILEESDPLRRLRLMLIQVRSILQQLAADPLRQQVGEEE